VFFCHESDAEGDTEEAACEVLGRNIDANREAASRTYVGKQIIQ
jgi:hypothetical protein